MVAVTDKEMERMTKKFLARAKARKMIKKTVKEARANRRRI
jgi:hypothetical protein